VETEVQWHGRQPGEAAAVARKCESPVEGAGDLSGDAMKAVMQTYAWGLPILFKMASHITGMSTKRISYR
jgi:hypothetical protein